LRVVQEEKGILPTTMVMHQEAGLLAQAMETIMAAEQVEKLSYIGKGVDLAMTPEEKIKKLEETLLHIGVNIPNSSGCPTSYDLKRPPKPRESRSVCDGNCEACWKFAIQSLYNESEEES
jgi:hypothetical protein